MLRELHMEPGIPPAADVNGVEMILTHTGTIRPKKDDGNGKIDQMNSLGARGSAQVS